MCKEHVDEVKSISHVCELHGTVDKDDFKYYVNLYKRYGESLRQVSLDLGLINYKILSDWVKKI